MTCIFCLTFSVGARTKEAAISATDDAAMYPNASTWQMAQHCHFHVKVREGVRHNIILTRRSSIRRRLIWFKKADETKS